MDTSKPRTASAPFPPVGGVVHTSPPRALQDGVFTDGSCEPNPGPGGWGSVAVTGGEVQWVEFGHELDTTNNRMELLAIIKTLERLPADAKVRVCGGVVRG